MTKYHINPTTGNPGICRAEAGKCPHGANAPHFNSKEEAREAFEKQQGAQSAPAATRQPGVRLQRRADKYKVPTTWNDLPKKANDEELKNASAYAQVKGAIIPADYSYDDHSSHFQPLDYDDGMGHRFIIGEKSYTMADSSGGFVKLHYVSDLDAQYDDDWEYHPSVYADYSYYSSLEDLKNDKPAGKAQRIEINANSVLTESRWGGSGPSYDQRNGRETAQKARQAIEQVPRAKELARIAYLNHSPVKLSKDEVLGKNGFGNPDEHIRVAALSRKEFPLDAHENALNDPSLRVKAALAKRPDLSKETMEKLLDNDGKVTPDFEHLDRSPRENVLRNPKLPVRMVNKYIKEGTVHDLRSLHNNPGITEKARATLNERAAKLGIRLW